MMNRDREGKSNRETRHLWAGNFPEDSTEESILTYFERYGQVEAVKILPRRKQLQGIAAFVDFVDIRCAVKAFETPNRVGDRIIKTDYNEPSAGVIAKSRNRQTQDSSIVTESPGRMQYINRHHHSGENTRHDSRRPKSRHFNSYVESDSSEQERYTRKFREGGHYSARVRNSPHPERRNKFSNTDKIDPSTMGFGNESRSRSRSYDDISTPGGILRVTNLSSRCDDEAMREALFHEFKKFSDTVHVKIFDNVKGRYALLRFSRLEDAEEAVKARDGYTLLGSEMKVHFVVDGDFHLDSSIQGLSQNCNYKAMRSLLVSNLDLSIGSEFLRDLFSRYGKILDINLEDQENENLSCAYVHFCSIDDAIRAKNNISNDTTGKYKFKLQFTVGIPTKSIWVDNISSRTTDEAIKQLFSKFGKIEKLSINRLNRAALVFYDNLESAKVAIDQMTGYRISDRSLMISYASTGTTASVDSADSCHLPSDRTHEKYASSKTRRSRSIDHSFTNRGSREYRRHEQFRSRGDRGSYSSGYSGTIQTHSYNCESKSHRYSGHREYESDDYSKELHDYDYLRQKDRERERVRSWKRKRYDREFTVDEEDAGSYQKDDTFSEGSREERQEIAFSKRYRNESDTSSYDKEDIDAATDEKLYNNNDEKVISEDSLSTTMEGSGERDCVRKDNDCMQSSEDTGIQCSNGNIANEDAVKESVDMIASAPHDMNEELNPAKVETDVIDERQLIENISAPDLQKIEADSVIQSSHELSASNSVDNSTQLLIKAESPSLPLLNNNVSDNMTQKKESLYSSTTNIVSSTTGITDTFTEETEKLEKSLPDNSLDEPDDFNESSEIIPRNAKPADDVINMEKSAADDDGLSSPNSQLNVDELLQRYPLVWQGVLMLKNDTVVVQMYLLCGSKAIATESLSVHCKDGKISPLKIAQRMKLEASQLENVSKRMQNDKEFCLLLALPCGRDFTEMQKQTHALQASFVSYLQQKEAAGIINITLPGSEKIGYVLHIFPPCDFSNCHLMKNAPDLIGRATASGHLTVLVAMV